ncbi:MAG: beta-lactamase family protein [candidate division WOR-3 bacterium]|nr:MAG: beta-lactamase family protein [candidate division WOR-3 bacterium]
MRNVVISLNIFLLSGALAYSQSFDQLRIKLENCLRENNIPGTAVAVVTADSVLFTGGFGYANINMKTPVTVNTHFFLGSITKSFIALGIVKLMEEGKVDLSAPVSEILPEVIIQNPWEDTDPVRVVHLLEHTAGICDGFVTLFNWRHERDIPLNEVMRMHKRIVIHHRPGSFYLYSNVGYLLAGMILEKITQMKYEEFLRNEFLLPLGMETSTFDVTDPYSRSVLAQGYGAGGEEIPYVYIYSRPAGHAHSSVLEMAQYVRFFLNYGKSNGLQIIKPETMDRVEMPQTSLASRMGLFNGYGLGSEWSYRNQHRWRGHNGATFGYYSDFWYNHDLNIGYVVLVNQFDMQSAGNVRKLRELIAEHLTENVKPDFQPIISVSREQLEDYCGTYTIGYGAKDLLGLINILHGMTEVKLSGDTLLIKQPLSGGHEDYFFPVAEGLFRMKDMPGATLAFFTTPEGAKAMVWGRDYLEEQSPWKYWLTVVFLLWTVLVMLSAVIYGCFWVLVFLFKKVGMIQRAVQCMPARIYPFIAIVVLTAGIILIANQEMYYLGKLTFANVSFFISTWLFAFLSMVSLISAIKCLKQPAGKIFRVYHMVTACTYVSMTIFLWYWGVIGLKLWM